MSADQVTEKADTAADSLFDSAGTLYKFSGAETVRVERPQ
jgi:hypothetical protein